jgi:hypothetical protein
VRAVDLAGNAGAASGEIPVGPAPKQHRAKKQQAD